ncbi:MAG: hypothetical protein HeimC2_26800 [Candidatus Heimdallarchaeota archaeon LC_2]|nr:MAG: hypothetical protein HeimC2_26800 [Candidatus Heimdallarchaeota archaeon LC_2]
MNRKNKLFLKSSILIVSFIISFYGIGTANASTVKISQATDIKLGGLFPLTGTLSGGGVEREAAFRYAVDLINADDTTFPDINIVPVIKDTETNPDTGVQVAGEVISDGVVGIVGAASSGVSKAIASGPGQASKIPQISYSSTNAGLSNSTAYPYFLRVVPGDQFQGQALAGTLDDLDITAVATLASNDDYGLGGITIFEDEFEAAGGTIVTKQRFDQGATDVKAQLQAIADSTATVIVINAIVGDAGTVFSQAGDIGVTAKDGYKWVGSDGPTQKASFQDSGVTNEDKLAAMQGMIGTSPLRGVGTVYADFLAGWALLDSGDFAGAGDDDANLYATYAFDATFTFAHALQAMAAAGEDYEDGDLLLAKLKLTDFTGTTGKVTFDVNGDRLAVYDVVNLVGEEFIIVGDWNTVSGLTLDSTVDIDFDGEQPDSDNDGLPGFGIFIAIFSIAVITITSDR